VISTTRRKPEAATHWSVGRLPRRSAFRRPRCTASGRSTGSNRTGFSTDSDFDPKLACVDLHPPERALAPCADEKSQIQALDRIQPALPMRPGLLAAASSVIPVLGHKRASATISGQPFDRGTCGYQRFEVFTSDT